MISEEFFLQGDLEKENDLPISMYCDRKTTILSKSQIGFLRNISLPLYEVLNFFLNSEQFTENCFEQLKNNINAWEYDLSKARKQTLKHIEIVRMMSECNSAPLKMAYSSVLSNSKG